MVGVDALTRGGADDRLDPGAQVAPPVGAEAAGYLAVCCHVAEFAFGPIVVWRDLGIPQEDEEAVAKLEVAFPEPLAVPVGRGERQDGGEIALQAAPVFPAGAVLKGEPPTGQH